MQGSSPHLLLSPALADEFFPLVPHDKESTSRTGDAGDLSSIPGLGRFPGGGYSNSLQDSCLKYPMDRGAWWATVYGVTKSQTQLK